MASCSIGALSRAMGVQDLLKELAKDRNSIDLTEAEDIKKRWQEIHRRTVQKKIFMIQITTMGCSLTKSQTSWSVKSSGP